MKSFEGVFTALVTPFKNGHVDESSLRRLVQFQIKNGVHGFVVSGTTAESPCLSLQEKRRIFEVVKSEVPANFPIIVGTGSNSTTETIRLTQEAEIWGANAALVVVPYYNKPPQRGLVAHFRQVAHSTHIPILLYNVPSRTIAKLELETIVSLSAEPKIFGIKEATGDIDFGRAIISKAKPGFLVTGGDDASCVDLMLSGGKGVISVASHILPKEFVEFSKLAMAGNEEVRSRFEPFHGLVDFLFCEANPIPVKAALHLMGILDSSELRLPLVALESPNLENLRTLMRQTGLLK